MPVGRDQADTRPAPNGDSPRQRARRIVAGHYELELEAPLGSGGMALVYRGRDLRTRRVVALKTLRPEYRRDPETRARFRREARTMAFLRHPSVARVYDLYEDEQAPWVVLEYVPGQSLKDLVRQKGPLPLEDIAEILEHVADALGHLHERGMVHLDVKPQNVIQTPEGTIKLIDFGLAQGAGVPQETVGGLTFGTAAYLAPEQACGEPVTAGTDVYALGCVVYELLTGQPPFEPNGAADKHDVIRARLESDPTPPSALRPELSLPAWVDTVVLRALARDPANRYDDVREFARRFRAGVNGASVSEATTNHTTLPASLTDESASRRWTATNLAGRATGALYRAGGRRLRHATAIRRLLWRGVLLLAVANAILAGLLYIESGSIPGIISASSATGQSNQLRVTVPEGLNVRSAPGFDAPTITVAAEGTSLLATGPEVEADGATWWPIAYEVDGERVDGYVWAGGVERVREESKAWYEELIERAGDVLGG